MKAPVLCYTLRSRFGLMVICPACRETTPTAPALPLVTEYASRCEVCAFPFPLAPVIDRLRQWARVSWETFCYRFARVMWGEDDA